MSEKALVDMWTRRFGEENVITRQVSKNEVSEYRKQGWVGPNEPIPIPDSPYDVEVLELKVKDREKEHQKALHAVQVAVGYLHDAKNFLDRAKIAIAKEPGIQAAQTKERERVEIQKSSYKFLLKQDNKPVSLGLVLRLAITDNQAAYLRELYHNDYYVVGRGPEGDLLIVADKAHYLAEKSKREQEEAAAKEAAIRARMEATV